MKLLILILGCICSVVAYAETSIIVTDGGTSVVKMSLKDTVRLRVMNAEITSVIGDVRIGSQGRITVDLEAKGEAYLRFTAKQPDAEPAHIFVATATGTYGLLIVPTDIPANTIILIDAKQKEKKFQQNQYKVGSHIKAVKNIIIALASDQLDHLDVRLLNQSTTKWKEVEAVFIREVSNGTCVGEQYRLIAREDVLLDEQEFVEKNVAAVAIDRLILKRGEMTHAYLVRCSYE